MDLKYPLKIKAPAKLNLFLHVIGKINPYHQIESLICFINLYDEITLTPAEETSCTLTGPYAHMIADEDPQDNLAVRALKTMQQKLHIGIPNCAINIHKNIPVGAGLGGGSSDAGAIVKIWEKYFEEDEEGLFGLAETIGSDVMACVQQKPCYMFSRGESLSFPMKISKCYVLLMIPPMPLSTKEVYAKVSITDWHVPLRSFPAHLPQWEQLLYFLQNKENSLWPAATKLYPFLTELTDAARQQPHAAYVRMTGSGSTCFALFQEKPQAVEAKRALEKQFPDVTFLVTTTLK